MRHLRLSRDFPYVLLLTDRQLFQRGFRGTPFEKEVSTKTVGQLAELLRDATFTNDFVQKTIVEHTLNLKLADVQAKGSRWSGWLSATGSVLAVFASYYLGASSNNPTKVECACTQGNQQNGIYEPVQVAKPPVKQPMPENADVKRHESTGNSK